MFGFRVVSPVAAWYLAALLGRSVFVAFLLFCFLFFGYPMLVFFRDGGAGLVAWIGHVSGPGGYLNYGVSALALLAATLASRSISARVERRATTLLTLLSGGGSVVELTPLPVHRAVDNTAAQPGISKGILAIGELPVDYQAFSWRLGASVSLHAALVLLALSKSACCDPIKSRRPGGPVIFARLGGSKLYYRDPRKEDLVLKSNAVLPRPKAAKLSESAKPVDAPYEFDPDLDYPQQLRPVLAARSASLGFGREDEPDTYRVILEGPGWNSVKRFDEPRYVKTGFFEIKITGAAFLLKLRRQHPECDDLTLVYGLFPVEFETVIIEQMQKSARARPDRKPTGFIVKFDSRVEEGVTVTMKSPAKS